MRKSAVRVTGVMLLASGMALAQAGGAGGARGAGNFQQTTIQGCLSGSDGEWMLDQGSTKYQLHGNNDLLSAYVGKQVAMVGTVAPGASNQGANFYVQNMQKVADSCEGGGRNAALRTIAANEVGSGSSGTIPAFGSPTADSETNNISGCLTNADGSYSVVDETSGAIYRLEGGNFDGATQHIVRVSGYLATRPAGPNSDTQMFHADRVQSTGETCSVGARAGLPIIAITGKTGNNGTVTNESTTASPDKNVPGAETEAGRSQNPAMRMSQGRSKAQHPEMQPGANAPGHPPNWEEVGESPGKAADLAAGAEDTEIGASQGTYGVGNRRPDYSKNENVSGAMTQNPSQSKPAAKQQKKPAQPQQ